LARSAHRAGTVGSGGLGGGPGTAVGLGGGLDGGLAHAVWLWPLALLATALALAGYALCGPRRRRSLRLVCMRRLAGLGLGRGGFGGGAGGAGTAGVAPLLPTSSGSGGGGGVARPRPAALAGGGGGLGLGGVYGSSGTLARSRSSSGDSGGGWSVGEEPWEGGAHGGGGNGSGHSSPASQRRPLSRDRLKEKESPLPALELGRDGRDGRNTERDSWGGPRKVN